MNIDAVLLANNHTGDYDTEGVKDTLDTFRNLNIRTVGAGMDLQEAAKPLHIEHNGLKIALFNVLFRIGETVIRAELELLGRFLV